MREIFQGESLVALVPSSRSVQMKLLPIAPLKVAKGVDAYCEALDAALADDSVHNIAIAAQYGAGKSTFLQTYFNRKKFLGLIPKKVLWVSLATFLELDKEKKNSVEFEQRLETSVLQQMFYAAKDTELPFSRFNRIAETGIGRYLKFIVIPAVCCWAWLCLPSVWRWMAVVPFVMFMMDCMRRLSLALSIKFKNAEISMSEKADVSVFNRFLDEVIYYFATIRYDAVVFEDIDRFEDARIFVKLRELNQVLNNARQIPRWHRPVRFIYAVRDDLLSSGALRVKFFDAIIPIVPTLNPENAADHFIRGLKKSESVGKDNVAECERLAHTISPFLKDFRIVNNIINEFAVIRRKLKSTALLDQRLLAMVVFKNYFPSEYDRACHKEGLLPRVFGDVLSKARISISQSAEEKIEKIRKTIAEITSDKEHSIDALNQKYFLEGLLPILPRGTTNLQRKGGTLPYRSFMQPSVIPAMIGNTHLCGNDYSQILGSIEWKHIELKVGGDSYEARKERIEKRCSGELEKLVQELAALDAEKRRMQSLSMQKVIETGSYGVGAFKQSIDGKEDIGEEYALLYALLAEGWIAEDYINYVSQYAGTENAQGDFEYRIAVMNGRGCGADFNVSNPAKVVEEIPCAYFSSSVILNHSVLSYFVESGRSMDMSDTKSQQFFGMLVGAIDGFRFLADHLRIHTDEHYRGKLIDSIALKTPEYEFLDVAVAALSSANARADADVILGSWIQKKYTDEAGDVKLSTVVCKYLSEAPNLRELLGRLNLDDEAVKTILTKNQIKFQHMELKELTQGVRDIIVSTCSYEVAYSSLENVMRALGCPMSKYAVQNLTTIRTCGNDYIKDYVLDDERFVNTYIAKVYGVLPVQEEPELVVVEVLNKPDMSRSACRTFLSRQQCLISDASALKNPNAYEVAFLDGKVKPSWRNAEYLFRVSCVKDEGWDSEGLKMLEAFLSRNWTGLKSFVDLEPKFEDELRNLVQSKQLVLAHKEQQEEIASRLGVNDKVDEDVKKKFATM